MPALFSLSTVRLFKLLIDFVGQLDLKSFLDIGFSNSVVDNVKLIRNLLGKKYVQILVLGVGGWLDVSFWETRRQINCLSQHWLSNK